MPIPVSYGTARYWAIHATDTVAAAHAGWKGELPAEAAGLTMAISAVRTTLRSLHWRRGPDATVPPNAAGRGEDPGRSC
jgi:hypothetical protein